METVAEATQGSSFWNQVVGVWQTGVFGIDLGQWIVAALIMLAFLALRRVLSTWMRRWVEKLTERTQSQLDDKVGEALQEPLSFVPVAFGFFVASNFLGLSGIAAEIADAVSKSLIAFTIFWILVRLVDPLSLLANGLEKLLGKELVAWFMRATKIALWLIGGATILEIWGIRVAPIIAGFGLLGVAVALGAQDLFKNLISGILILGEKRFRVGDWVKIDGMVEGTVEQINFRSTKVRRFDKAPVYIPNAAFADGAVVNFGERTNRRIYWTISLEYRTTAAQLAEIRQSIEDYIKNDGRYMPADEASLFVRIDAFNDSSIDLLIYCFTKTRDWAMWLEIKEELLLKIKEIVEEAGSGFAFPSRSLYIEGAPATAMPLDTGETDSKAVADTGPAARKPAAKEPAKSRSGSAKIAAKRTTTARETKTGSDEKLDQISPKSPRSSSRRTKGASKPATKVASASVDTGNNTGASNASEVGS